MSREALISDLVERLQQRLGALLPRQSLNAVLEQVRATLRQAFAELDLVPRRELDDRVEELEQLRRTVEDLERRIRELERH